MDAFHAEESVGHGRACVAAGGNQHVYFLLAFLADEVLKQPGHEPGAYVLEGQCGAVEEFERIDVVGHFHGRAVKLQRVVDNALQVGGFHIFSEEGVGHGIGYFLERHLVYVVEKLLGKLLDLFGHIETAVFCQSLHHSLVKVGYRCFFVG